VNPRSAIDAIAQWLSDRYGVRLLLGVNVSAVQGENENAARPRVVDASGAAQDFDRVVVCGGVDVPLLFPREFQAAGLRICKLQMLRTVSQAGGWRIGPHLASGLTLRHYHSFDFCPSHAALRQRIAAETPELDQFGIHVMASQTDDNAIILGDSHEYDREIEIFDKSVIDDLILRELRRIICLPDWTIAERWHGLYAKHPSLPIVEIDAAPRVHLCTGTGGAGMTMSFGLAEQAWSRWAVE
jgi:FAD dependent oxidoreductase TIGR03364